MQFASHVREVHNEIYESIVVGFETYKAYANLRRPFDEFKDEDMAMISIGLEHFQMCFFLFWLTTKDLLIL